MKNTYVNWDYTKLAASYDKRADYAEDAIIALVNQMQLAKGDIVADIGAGTGKLTKELLKLGLEVRSIEPNDEMRRFGIENTQGKSVAWYDGAAEETGLAAQAVSAVFFGSSFNVVDKSLALKEAQRIVAPRGYFACMWNHRDLDDPLQQEIEALILRAIPDYDYGDRRIDQADILNRSNMFSSVDVIEGTLAHKMSVTDCIEAWRSHGTLQRQAGSQFGVIIDNIAELLKEKAHILVPYKTKIWFGQFK